jgi:hypothetical protein
MTAMAESRFDIQFAGELVAGADPGATRERLGELFKLPPEGLDRLFDGQPHILKRDLDQATAVRFRDAFGEAGAILRLIPIAVGPELVAPEQAATEAAKSDPPVERTVADGGLTLAPLGTKMDVAASPFVPRVIDTSGLSLVPGWDWTLEDCAPPVRPVPFPEIGYLSLIPAEPVAPRPADDVAD